MTVAVLIARDENKDTGTLARDLSDKDGVINFKRLVLVLQSISKIIQTIEVN